MAGFDISCKLGLGGGVAFDGESFGASIGFGIGGAVSVIADNKFVLAFTIEDVASYENAVDKISKGKKKGYSVNYSTFVDKDGYTNVYAKMQKTSKNGKTKTKTVTLLTRKQDKEKNAVYTKKVKRSKT